MRALRDSWKNWFSVQVVLFFVLLGSACVPTTGKTAVLPTLVATAVSVDAQGQPLPTETATPAGRMLPPTSTPIPTQELRHFAEGGAAREETAVLQPAAAVVEATPEAIIPTIAPPTMTPTATSLPPTVSPATITTDPNAWLTYKSATRGLTMRYPPEMFLGELDAAGVFSLSFSFSNYLVIDTAADVYHNTGLILSMMPAEGFSETPNIDPTDPHSILAQGYLQELPVYDLEYIQPVTSTTVAGQPAATALVHRSIKAGGKIQQANYYVIFLVNDHVVVILGDVAIVEQATMLPIFQAMVDSIAFEN